MDGRRPSLKVDPDREGGAQFTVRGVTRIDEFNEYFGVKLPDIRDVATEILRQGKIDYLDMSLWDYTIEPADEAFKGRSLMSIFTEIPRGDVRLGVAGRGPHSSSNARISAVRAFNALRRFASHIMNVMKLPNTTMIHCAGIFAVNSSA